VLPSFKYFTPLKRLLKRSPRLVDAIPERSEGRDDRPLYSMSNTLTSASPAHVTRVRSLEWGINLTEKIFCVWPVETVVVRANCEHDDSGW